MRFAVLSDIHGNMPALEAVLDDLRQFQIDGIIVAGDTVVGPQQNEALSLLRSCHSRMIQGNNEIALVKYAAGETPTFWRTSHQFEVARWTYQKLSREALEYIRSLPEQMVIQDEAVPPIRVVHGSPRSPTEGLFYDNDPAVLLLVLEQMQETVLICGHTHVPWKFEQGERLALNPGAVGGPLNGDTCAQYALLDWEDGHWKVEHYAVTYDLNLIRRAFIDTGLLEEGGVFARAFLLSIETGQNVSMFFLDYAYHMAAEVGYKNCDVVPDDIWEKAAASFNWGKYEP